MVAVAGARRAIRGRILTFLDDPALAGAGASHRYLSDGLVVVGEEGRIAEVGEADALLPSLPKDLTVDRYPDKLIVPGFIDAHLHYPQTQVIASYGAQLLEWLQKYTFVEERKFSDAAHARRVAGFFLDELLRNGTTTAGVYCTVHPQSVDAFFAEAEARGMLMLAGKVMMDRGAPEGLLDTPQSGYDESKALIARWHGKARLRYAVTPRFAVTSTGAQLEMAGALLAEHPGIHMQTHLSENTDEIAAVRALFPEAASYTGVYDHYGLLGPTSLFGHAIHLGRAERERLSESGSVVVYCPTSNLFIGSGLFDLAGARSPAHPLRTAIATDVGGGTSYSMLQTLAEGYKVQQLRGLNLPALEGFYMATLGNARALGLEGEIGALAPGAYADLAVLDARATPAMAHRMETVEGSLDEELFVLMTLGDDRAVQATYVAGRPLHRRGGDAG